MSSSSIQKKSLFCLNYQKKFISFMIILLICVCFFSAKTQSPYKTSMTYYDTTKLHKTYVEFDYDIFDDLHPVQLRIMFSTLKCKFVSFLESKLSEWNEFTVIVNIDPDFGFRFQISIYCINKIVHKLFCRTIRNLTTNGGYCPTDNS